MRKPLVSICLPNFNHRPFLEERLNSILQQTIADWELIVCDSYSTDGSWEYLKKFEADPRVRLYQVPRLGVYAGWNECLQRANGKYIWIATSDDTADSKFLEFVIEPLEKIPEIWLATCDYQPIDTKGKPLCGSANDLQKRAFLGEWYILPCIRPGETEFLLQTCFGTMWTTMSAVVFKRSLCHKIGLFQTDCGVWADLEWSLRASLVTDIAYIPQKLVTWRSHEKQASNSDAWARYNYKMIARVLNDPQAGIPPQWHTVHNWKQQILEKAKWDYYDSFQLFRHVAWNNPLLFTKNFFSAFVREPMLLSRQILNGFKWSKEFSPDPAEFAMQLIRLFDAPWPPRKLLLY